MNFVDELMIYAKGNKYLWANENKIAKFKNKIIDKLYDLDTQALLDLKNMAKEPEKFKGLCEECAKSIKDNFKVIEYSNNWFWRLSQVIYRFFASFHPVRCKYNNHVEGYVKFSNEVLDLGNFAYRICSEKDKICERGVMKGS